MQVTDAASAPYTPGNLIPNVFLGDGVEVTNVTFKGEPVSVGYFSGGQQAVGLERGIVMTTGAAETDLTAIPTRYGCESLGQNFAGIPVQYTQQFDADLAQLSAGTFWDLTTYTITFIPTADTLRFRYCFASEEYPEYSCSQYNDVFGFFIQGPGYPAPTNIALIPGTSLPVAINNLHPDNFLFPPCPPLNLQYYIDNDFSNKQPTYDGLTRVFTAEAVVVPCQTYTIKLGIVDVGDDSHDSAVFLEAKSFGTGSLRAEVASPSLDGMITEGCSGGTLTFRLPAPVSTDFPIDYNIIGTATNGVDYQLIPPGLFIPAGQSEVSIPIVALEDNMPETGEFIAVDIRRDPCTRDTLQIFLRDNQIAPPDLPAEAVICSSGSLVALDGTLPVPLPQPRQFSNTTDMVINPVDVAVFSAINVNGVLPTTLQPGMIRSVCVNITHGWTDDLDVYLIAPGGQFLELMTDCGGAGKNFINTCFTPAATAKIGQATAFDGPFTGDWQPEGPWSDLWSGGAFPANGQWRLQLRDDQGGIVGTLNDWTITFEPVYGIKYAWSPATGLSCSHCPATAASPAATTTYNLTATDSYGCVVQDSVQIKVDQALEAPLVNCNGFSGNSVSFSWNNVTGASGFEVNVNGAGWESPTGTTTHQVNGLLPGAMVEIEVRAITPPDAVCNALIGSALCSACPEVSITPTHVTCFDGDDGAAAAVLNGGVAPFTYQWSDPLNQTAAIAVNLEAGTYTVTVTDADGCTATASVTLTQPPNLVISVTANPAKCFGEASGMATVSASGGIGPYQFAWSNSQTGSTATNLLAGTYAVTVTDAVGCPKTSFALIGQPLQIVANITTVPVSCNGGTNGSATVTASGGTPPLTYKWSDPAGQSTTTASNLSAGVYTVTITDKNNCTATQTAAVTAPPAIQVNLTGTDLSCNGVPTGSASVSAVGGNGSLTYKWSAPGSPTGATVSNLAAGAYTVTVTDGNNCSATGSITINQPPAMSLTIVKQNVTCFDDDDGSAAVSVNGGAGNKTYQWSDPAGQTTAAAVNLKAGVYTVTATDMNGCTATASTTLTQPTDLMVSVVANQAKCFGEASGSASVSASGGVGPYQYAWSNTQSGPNAGNLTAGTYTVTVTDAAGCAKTSFALIGQPSAITANVITLPVKCHGNADGSASVNLAQGGTPPLTYKWSDPAGQTTAAAANLSAGVYTVTITDKNNCTLTQSATVTEPPAIQLAVTGQNLNCNNVPNGSAMATASGGTGSLTYKWNDPAGQASANATGLNANTYTVTVTDGNGCTATGSITISQPPALTLSGAVQNINCFGANNGQVSVTPEGGTAPYIYQWNTSENGAVILNKPAGSYTVTVTDAGGCTAVYSATITQPPVLTAAAVSQNIRCFAQNTGSIQLNISGGTGTYQVSWAGPGGFTGSGAALDNLAAGTYSATVTDAAGCTVLQTVTLTQPASALSVVVSPPPVTICFGASNGSVHAVGNGGALPYSFLWNNGQNNAAAKDLPAGIYTVTVTDANQCTATVSATISQKEKITVSTEGGVVDCFGSADGTARVTAVLYGATPANLTDFLYQWSTVPPQTGVQASGLVAGQTYTVTVTDASGCTATQTAAIASVPPVTAVITTTNNPSCFDSADGLVIASGAGGVPPYAYTWSSNVSAAVDSLAQGLSGGVNYRVTATDAKGCTGVANVVLTAPPALKVSFQVAQALCNGENNGSAKAIASGGTAPYQFQWSNGAASDAITQVAAGLYQITLTDAKGCTLNGDVEIDQPDIPLGGTATQQDVGCFGGHNGTITIAGSGGTPPYRYALNDGAWNGSSVQIGLSAGIYTPRIQDKNGCIADLAPVEITQRPAIGLDLGPTIRIELGETTQLFAQVSNAADPVEYFWNPADSLLLSCLDCPDPLVDTLVFEHWFELTVVDAFGCVAENRVLVVVEKPRKVFVPTAFSPNGDGSNDLLLVHGQSTTKVISFRVFDRWGELLYEGNDFPLNDPASGWDGNFRGQPMDPGVYVWVLEVEYRDGVREVYKGDTTLIR